MEQLPPIEDAATASSPPATPMSLAARLFNIFATPGEVFDDIKTRPPATANWLVPAILYGVVGVVGFWLVLSQPAIQQQMREMTWKAMDQQFAKQKLPPAEAEKIKEKVEPYLGLWTKLASCGGVVVEGFVSPFLWGLFLYLAGTRALKAQFSFMKAVEVAGLSKMIDIFGVTIAKLLAILTSNLMATPSLALLIKEFDTQNPVHMAAGLTDITLLWMLAVRAIGLAKLANVTFAKAAIWVIGIWLTYSGLMLGGSIAAQALTGR